MGPKSSAIKTTNSQAEIDVDAPAPVSKIPSQLESDFLLGKRKELKLDSSFEFQDDTLTKKMHTGEQPGTFLEKPQDGKAHDPEIQTDATSIDRLLSRPTQEKEDLSYDLTKNSEVDCFSLVNR